MHVSQWLRLLLNSLILKGHSDIVLVSPADERMQGANETGTKRFEHPIDVVTEV